jgi:hypothetical protein
MALQGLDNLAVTIQCWREADTGTTRLRIERLDRPEEVQLADATFLVRVAFDQGRLMERCYIRHVGSGREAYVQGGPALSAFVRASLLADAPIVEAGLAEREDG